MARSSAGGRPEPSEYAEFYEPYVSCVPDGPILEFLGQQQAEARTLFASVPEPKETFRYAEGKWSLRELVGHVIDSERVFAFRALAFAREDPAPIPGFEENQYAGASNGAGTRKLHALADEFDTVRQGTLHLLGGLAGSAWSNQGTASGHPVTVRALAWIIGGHAAHHFTILRERYLSWPSK